MFLENEVTYCCSSEQTIMMSKTRYYVLPSLKAAVCGKNKVKKSEEGSKCLSLKKISKSSEAESF